MNRDAEAMFGLRAFANINQALERLNSSTLSSSTCRLATFVHRPPLENQPSRCLAARSIAIFFLCNQSYQELGLTTMTTNTTISPSKITKGDSATAPHSLELASPSAVHNPPSRVLFIPEICDHIFSYLPRIDNARNAQVCKAWSDIALRIVWAKVNDLHALFSILVPMDKVHTDVEGVSYYRLVEMPSVADWNRFERYAAFVRSISYEPRRRTPKWRLIRQAILEISQSRIQHEVFPRLTSLTWRFAADLDAPPDFSGFLPTDAFLFAHPRVTSFSFSLPRTLPPPSITKFLLDIPSRMPGLTEITLSTALPVTICEDDLCRLFSNMPHVQIISLPANYLTSSLAERLAVLPTLTKLLVGYTQFLFDSSVPDYDPSLSEPSFIALRQLSIMAPLLHVTRLVKTISSRALSMLRFSSPETTLPEVRELLQLCAERQKELKRLRMKLRPQTLMFGPPGDFPSPITVQILHPIMQFSGLRELRIEHPSPLALSIEEIITIASALPSLSVLYLNPSPLQWHTSTLGLDVLPVIAKHCRYLTHLGLFVDASLAIPALSSSTSGFPKLDTLSVGASVVSKDALHRVALYLSDILPFSCELHYGAAWENSAMRASDQWSLEAYHAAAERKALWSETKDLIELLVRVRQQERAKAQR